MLFNRGVELLIKDIQKCKHFTAMDNTHLCELLHPAREKVEIHYSIAHAVLNPGRASLPHRLKESSEVYYILEGSGVINVEGEEAEVRKGQAVFIPPGSWQHIRNSGSTDLEFLAIVHPFWKKEDEEVEEVESKT
jgi:mannose-6-phosphate isomerase-like protein (cupin superfamily)